MIKNYKLQNHRGDHHFCEAFQEVGVVLETSEGFPFFFFFLFHIFLAFLSKSKVESKFHMCSYCAFF